MAFIRRNWTPRDANEWKKEDWIAIVISPLAYIALAVGVALSLLNMITGYVILLLAALLTLLLHWVIDPKLRAISKEYEKKQKKYLRDLEKEEKWEV